MCSIIFIQQTHSSCLRENWLHVSISHDNWCWLHVGDAAIPLVRWKDVDSPTGNNFDLKRCLDLLAVFSSKWQWWQGRSWNCSILAYQAKLFLSLAEGCAHVNCNLNWWPFSSLFMQVLDPSKRLGCSQMGGYGPLREHIFFEGKSNSAIHVYTGTLRLATVVSCWWLKV